MREPDGCSDCENCFQESILHQAKASCSDLNGREVLSINTQRRCVKLKLLAGNLV